MDQNNAAAKANETGVEDMLALAGYSEKAIKYYTEQPYMGSIGDADIVSGMTGTCGDTMKIFIKTENGIIEDVRYQVLGCAGAISSAMAVVDLVRGKSIEFARALDDGDVFRHLEEIPEKKHHCIQLSVKTMHKAIDESLNGSSTIGETLTEEGSSCPAGENAEACAGLGTCCGKSKLN